MTSDILSFHRQQQEGAVFFLLLISVSVENPKSQSQDDANEGRILIAFILSKGYFLRWTTKSH